jgi:hypothetical protein
MLALSSKPLALFVDGQHITVTVTRSSEKVEVDRRGRDDECKYQVCHDLLSSISTALL